MRLTVRSLAADKGPFQPGGDVCREAAEGAMQRQQTVFAGISRRAASLNALIFSPSRLNGEGSLSCFFCAVSEHHSENQTSSSAKINKLFMV